MRTVRRLADAKSRPGSLVAVGVFDGVHLGHQRFLTSMVREARLAGRRSIVVTFDRHPVEVFGLAAPPLLTSVEHRGELLARLGLDVLVVLPFTQETASTPAREFCEQLVCHLGLSELWAGQDFRLGRCREGDVVLLTAIGSMLGFSVRVVPPVELAGTVVSSSRIRNALRAGDAAGAMRCLGRPYRVEGLVVHGRGLGRTIGVPTANVRAARSQLVPSRGVYACLALVAKAGSYGAVTNIGVRPTVNGGDEVIEAHIIDYAGDLYGRHIALDFAERLRDERPFPSLRALGEQIREDIVQARVALDAFSARRGAQAGMGS
jgi:riboflavin kinase/FMN adenylyltransferase